MAIPWIEIDVHVTDDDYLEARVTATSEASGGKLQEIDQPDREELLDFADGVLKRAINGRGINAGIRETGRTLYEELFRGGIGSAADSLRGKGREQLLVRLMLSDAVLRTVPWEAMRGPSDDDGFLACNPSLRLVRGVLSTDPFTPREVRSAVRMLVIAPGDLGDAVDGLQRALQGPIGDGRIEWLDPAVGPLATWGELYDRLENGPQPHIIHFLGHGRVHDGAAQLLLDPDEQGWVPVENLASRLATTVADQLRLVYLESCSTAVPGQLASAAEQLTRKGVDAAIAHLWTVDAGAAHAMAARFYGALTRGDHAGDVAAALAGARLFQAGTDSLDFLCPVLYLRGHDPRLFDFSRRRLEVVADGDKEGDEAQRPARGLKRRHQRLLDRLDGELRAGSTLFVGPFVGQDGRELGHDTLREGLLKVLDSGRKESLASLMQRYELVEDRQELRDTFLEALNTLARTTADAPPLIAGLADLTGPGLFITLLWLPLLEDALSEKHPDREILVIQPREPGSFDKLKVFRRAPHGTQWERVRGELARLDFEQQLVVLRLFGGYAAKDREMYGNPVLTDDDQLFHLSAIENLPTQVQARISLRPLVLTGFSPRLWSHRDLLRRLTGDQPLKKGSLAVLGPEADESERRYWQYEEGPGGRGKTVETARFKDLMAVIDALGAG